MHELDGLLSQPVRASSTAAAGDRSSGSAVERRALLERPAQSARRSTELCLVELLAVARAGGPRDVLVHQGAAEIVRARLQDLAGPADPALDPRRLHVGDRVAVQRCDRPRG